MSKPTEYIFVTGATGVVGSAVIAELLMRPDVHVTALIRGESDDEVQRRGDALLQSIDRHTPGYAARFQVVRGDITKANLGLSENSMASVAAQTTRIVHSAGKVKLNQSIAEARQHAIFPAEQVISLAKRCGHLKKIDVLSTIGVAGKMEGNVPESRLTHEREFHNTYEQSKAEAEELYWQQAANGMPLSIHRPSMVVGDSKTGWVLQHQVFYYLCDFLSGQRTFGILPRFNSQMLDIVPVDYVSRCITASLFDSESVGKVFHLCSGPIDELRITHLRATIQNAYTSIGAQCRNGLALPKEVFAGIAWLLSRLGPKGLRKPAKTVPFFLAYLGRRQVFESQMTQNWFRRFDITLPKPSDYLDRIVTTYAKQSRSTRATQGLQS